jgi:hypothetical protein
MTIELLNDIQRKLVKTQCADCKLWAEHGCSFDSFDNPYPTINCCEKVILVSFGVKR